VTNLGCVCSAFVYYLEVLIKRERKNLLLSQPNLKERGVIMDNNKVLLSNLKTYSNIERLVKIQEQLANNKIIQEAKAKNIKNESYTASNPII
jgi:hypothetical protein